MPTERHQTTLKGRDKRRKHRDEAFGPTRIFEVQSKRRRFCYDSVGPCPNRYRLRFISSSFCLPRSTQDFSPQRSPCRPEFCLPRGKVWGSRSSVRGCGWLRKGRRAATEALLSSWRVRRRSCVNERKEYVECNPPAPTAGAAFNVALFLSDEISKLCSGPSRLKLPWQITKYNHASLSQTTCGHVG